MNYCSLCGKEASILFSDGKDYSLAQGNSPDFGIYFCPECEIGYSLPIMTNDELLPYYPVDYEAYVARKSFFYRGHLHNCRSDLRLIRKRVRKTAPSLFEAGAARGDFLACAKAKGFSVAGIEPGGPGREYAQKYYSIQLEDSLLENFVFRSRYDVVAARDVLEHSTDFMAGLRNIFTNALAPGGMLFLKLPRLDSWEARLFGKCWHGFDLPRHRVHFSKNGISAALREVGFTDISVTAESAPGVIFRSISCCRSFGTNIQLRLLSRLLFRVPVVLQYVLYHFIGLILFPVHPGRMTVFAKKPEA